MSPRGSEGVRQSARDIEARKAGGGGGGRNWFKLDEGETAQVRFLEDGNEFAFTWSHEVPVEGREYGRPVPCRDQDEVGNRNGTPCPGCDRNLKRSFKGYINLIRRDAPVLKRNADGRLVNTRGEQWKKGDTIATEGNADQVFVWQTGITVFEELDGKDVTYGGLTSRDFKVTRRGQKLNTRYIIEPANPDAGPQPMSEADRDLAKDKYDLEPDVTAPAFEGWGDPPQATTIQREEVREDTSPFLRPRTPVV